MFSEERRKNFQKEIQTLKETGLYKTEYIITTPQCVEIKIEPGKEVLNFCANNYLGLSSHPDVIKAAHKMLDEWGYGMSSVRFICGTQKVHKICEEKVSEFLGTEDTILYAACFDANGGVFEPFFDKETAIITDELNHASLIDGIRLTKAMRFIFKHGDMDDLERCLKEADTQNAKWKVIVTDGVFSMDGDIAKLDKIVPLAKKYDALIIVDDSHATGFMGKTGRGTHEYNGVMGEIDIITTTFGKALGGAMGGCCSGRKELIEWLRQKSRPYLFSNSLTPIIAGTLSTIIDVLSKSTELRDKLEWNTKYFRENMTKAGFDIIPGDHPIVPIMFGKYPDEAVLCSKFAKDMIEEGIYVINFSYPVVPRGKSRIRVQLSAAHEKHHIDRAIDAFIKVGRKHKIIN